MSFDINTGIGQVADLATTVINKIWPDKSEQEKQELAAALTVITGQLDINKVEAAHQSIFVAGWRPFVGWMGGVSLGYAFLLQPILSWFLAICGVSTPLPEPNTDAMMALVTAMLGVTAARSFDKWKGTAK